MISVKNCVWGICLAMLLILQAVHADIDTNEVMDNGAYGPYMLQGIKVYPNDRHCVMVGGLCVHTNDCLLRTSNTGLCPTSSSLGVECCYELPVRPAPCAQHLGDCKDSCNKDLQRPGTDCLNGQVCCVLI